MSRLPQIGTRGSDLALFQTRLIARWLAEKNVPTGEQIIKTRGDQDQRDFAHLSGDGFFTKEIEYALHQNRAQLAVHSAKDLPSTLHHALPWKAVGARATTTDVLILKGQRRLSKNQLGDLIVPAGFKIGTSSPRRHAQALRAWPGVVVTSLRGNVPTRARKIFGATAEYDAVILARAGLERLNLINELRAEGAEIIDLKWVTAPTQGVLALQARRDHEHVLDAVANLELNTLAMAEKSVLAMLGGGCHLPLGVQIDVNTRGGYRIEFFYEDSEGAIQGNFDCERLGDGLRIAFNQLLRVPVNGPRVWLTSPLYQHGRVAGMARTLDLAVGCWPLVEPTPTWSYENFQSLLHPTGSKIPLIFASPFAAQIFVREVIGMNGASWLNHQKIFALGAETAKPFAELKLKCEELPEEASAAGLAKQLASAPVSKQKKFCLMGTTRSKIPGEFKKQGLEVSTFELYDTRPSQSRLAMEMPRFDAQDVIAFSSPSAVDVFALHLIARPELRTLKFAALGPTTALALRAHGLEPLESGTSGSWLDLLKKIKT